MKIAHIISIGTNGGENIIQKYLNYIEVYKKLNIPYHLIILSPESINQFNFNKQTITHFKIKTVNNKCGIKRIWIKGVNYLNSFFKNHDYSHIILRIDFMDKNILNFIKEFKPILEYPTPPIEATLKGKKLYQKLAKKYNHLALKESSLNITTSNINYPNKYIFYNSLYDQHSKKTNYKISSTIKVLFMSSKYGADEYNGYDRFINGIEYYLKNNDTHTFEFIVAGKDIEGFKSMLSNFIVDQVKITYLGFKTINELNFIVKSIDLGINDLGFHRKGLQEANTLKTIDFLGWNLPFIVSHTDVNLKANQKFYLKVNENDKFLDIHKIIHFLYLLNRKDIAQMEIQSKEISLENRVKEFLLYLEENKNV